jgi:hypothetical protein
VKETLPWWCAAGQVRPRTGGSRSAFSCSGPSFSIGALQKNVAVGRLPASPLRQQACPCRKRKKELGKLKAPPEYSLKVDFSKVALPPINAWVAQRVMELLKGLEDEVLVGTITESLKQVQRHIS